jgi:hypothetical protein
MLDPAGSGAVSLPESLLPPPGILPCSHRLWTPRTRYDLIWCCGTTGPYFAVDFFPLTAPPSKVSLIPDHLIPHEAVIWATDKARMGHIDRITLYLGPGSGGNTNATTSSSSATDRPAAVLHGLRVEYVRNLWVPKMYAGMRRNVGEDDNPSATWPQDQVVSFDIDGPGGERIDEVAVSEASGDALGLKASLFFLLFFSTMYS